MAYYHLLLSPYRCGSLLHIDLILFTFLPLLTCLSTYTIWFMVNLLWEMISHTSIAKVIESDPIWLLQNWNQTKPKFVPLNLFKQRKPDGDLFRFSVQNFRYISLASRWNCSFFYRKRSRPKGIETKCKFIWVEIQLSCRYQQAATSDCKKLSKKKTRWIVNSSPNNHLIDIRIKHIYIYITNYDSQYICEHDWRWCVNRTSLYVKRIS